MILWKLMLSPPGTRRWCVVRKDWCRLWTSQTPSEPTKYYWWSVAQKIMGWAKNDANNSDMETDVVCRIRWQKWLDDHLRTGQTDPTRPNLTSRAGPGGGAGAAAPGRRIHGAPSCSPWFRQIPFRPDHESQDSASTPCLGRPHHRPHSLPSVDCWGPWPICPCCQAGWNPDIAEIDSCLIRGQRLQQLTQPHVSFYIHQHECVCDEDHQTLNTTQRELHPSAC